MGKVTLISGKTNQEFLEAHADAGRIGLASGSFRLDKLLRRAQRHVNQDKQ